jgi:hypothetical protein
MTHAEHDDDLEIYIEEPCSKSWDELSGDGTRRYCAKCSLHVHFGPAFTRREALRLVQNSSERVCMTLELDAAGKPRFKPEPTPPQAASARNSHWIASASAALLAACARTQPTDSSFATPVVSEAIAPVEASEPTVCHEPTVLDPLPVELPKRQPVPPAPPAEAEPVYVRSFGSTVVRRSGGAVLVRRPENPPTTPK